MRRFLILVVAGGFLFLLASCGLLDDRSASAPYAPAGPTIVNNMPPPPSDSSSTWLTCLLIAAVGIGVWMFCERRNAQRRAAEAELGQARLLAHLQATGQVTTVNGQPHLPGLGQLSHQLRHELESR